jgi:hypothetical protein
MKIIAILHRSAGNESVGDMWRETKIFDVEVSTIKDILRWAANTVSGSDKNYELFRGHLEITVAQE